MSDAQLPEELLREILSLLLSVSEADFCKFPDNGCPPWMSQQPRGRQSYRPPPICDVLLVSKRWLRVGTPLLYESVHVWSPEHVKAIAAVLRANPGVGKAVRRLRIEGGCGKELYTIVKHAPNVDTLYICLHVKASEGIAGLRKALPLMRPQKLYWLHRGLTLNKAAVEAKALLEKCIAEIWTSLRSINLYTFFNMTPEIACTLSKAPALRELIMDNNHKTREWIPRGFVRTIGQNRNLERITVMGIISKSSFLQALENTNTPSSIVELFDFVETESDRSFHRMFCNRIARQNEGDNETLFSDESHEDGEE
ncbi:hypothetical protein PsYK624_058040 [Phanerochaete sordida]|uniref:F-box domain-containing protein n=1 Tax=Phanerochaete sordida TaxID=48140 RepID=A0A9P3LCW5_9APHY|nr:hypothetical protein PsYK624_058040 [Phanerochaete sordida]